MKLIKEFKQEIEDSIICCSSVDTMTYDISEEDEKRIIFKFWTIHKVSSEQTIKWIRSVQKSCRTEDLKARLER